MKSLQLPFPNLDGYECVVELFHSSKSDFLVYLKLNIGSSKQVVMWVMLPFKQFLETKKQAFLVG